MVNLRKENQNKAEQKITMLIADHLRLEELAEESKFYRRPPKKITATNLFLGFMHMEQMGVNTLRNWVMEISKLSGEPVEKQSLNERLNEKAVKLMQLALKEALNKREEIGAKKSNKEIHKKITKIFNRIILRDSSTQNLPSHLHEIFPGNYNIYKATAVMRIQACYDYSNHKWLQLDLKSFRDNDQGSADCISNILEPNDLILQDLGYFSLKWLRQLTENHFVITRYMNSTNLYTETGEKIELLKFLGNKRETDLQVLVGKTEKLKMRMVARKLPKSKASKRIAKAKKDRHSKANHSKEYFELLKYEIYLTNVSSEKLAGKEIAKLYGLRWHIEILFKSWKSGSNFKKMFAKEKMNEHRVKFTIYAMLIQFVYLMTSIYPVLEKAIKEITDKPISILKFTQEMSSILDKILSLKSVDELLKHKEIYARNITYEKHTKRENTLNKYMYVKYL